VSELEFVGVSRRFRDGARGEVWAVRELGFRAVAGELVVLRGPSGSGKSTVLGLAAGLLLPTEGEVRVDGEVFSRTRENVRAEIRREKMGVVLQGLALISRMSVLENVLLGHVPDGTVNAAAVVRARALLERFGVGAMARATVETLSGGERQRVALARALVREAAIVLLDEPTAHLDDAAVDVVREVLRERLSRGALAVVATHDPRWDEGEGRVVRMGM